MHFFKEFQSQRGGNFIEFILGVCLEALSGLCWAGLGSLWVCLGHFLRPQAYVMLGLLRAFSAWAFMEPPPHVGPLMQPCWAISRGC